MNEVPVYTTESRTLDRRSRGEAPTAIYNCKRLIIIHVVEDKKAVRICSRVKNHFKTTAARELQAFVWAHEVHLDLTKRCFMCRQRNDRGQHSPRAKDQSGFSEM